MVFDELSPLLPRSGVVNPPSYGLLCVVPPSHARSPGKGKQKCDGAQGWILTQPDQINLGCKYCADTLHDPYR